MSQRPLDKVLADDYAAYSGKLDHPSEGRWKWFWRNRKAARHLRRLRQTTPALIKDYRDAQRNFRKALAQVQKDPRRLVRRLRLQLVFASISAVFRRYAKTIQFIAALAAAVAAAAAIWFNLPFLISLFDTPPAPAPFPDLFGQGPR